MITPKLVTYGFALFMLALIPGPGITALVARSLGAGFIEGFVMALGLILGDVIFLTAVVLGLSVFAQTFGLAFLIVKYAGVAYLLWLAFRIWRAGIPIAEIEASGGRSILHSFLSGLLVTLGNPKAMLFYVALVPTLIDIGSIGTREYLLLIAITIGVLLMVTVPYVLLAAKARDLLRRPAALKTLNRLSACFLAATAGYIALKAS